MVHARLVRHLILLQTHKCSLLIMGPHIFQKKLCQLNSSVGAAWSEMQFEVFTSCFYKSKIEEAKRGGKSAIWIILCCRMSITVVYIPPSSMNGLLFQYNKYLISISCLELYSWAFLDFFQDLGISNTIHFHNIYMECDVMIP